MSTLASPVQALLQHRTWLPRSFIRVIALSVVGLVCACSNIGGSYFLTPGLNDDRAQRIRAGMSALEVKVAIGNPHQRVRFDNLKATAWDYRYIDTWGYITDFAVMVGDDGRVVNTVSARHFADDQ